VEVKRLRGAGGYKNLAEAGDIIDFVHTTEGRKA
jgi:hypothetical protein